MTETTVPNKDTAQDLVEEAMDNAFHDLRRAAMGHKVDPLEGVVFIVPASFVEGIASAPPSSEAPVPTGGSTMEPEEPATPAQTLVPTSGLEQGELGTSWVAWVKPTAEQCSALTQSAIQKTTVDRLFYQNSVNDELSHPVIIFNIDMKERLVRDTESYKNLRQWIANEQQNDSDRIPEQESGDQRFGQHDGPPRACSWTTLTSETRSALQKLGWNINTWTKTAASGIGRRLMYELVAEALRYLGKIAITKEGVIDVDVEREDAKNNLAQGVWPDASLEDLHHTNRVAWPVARKEKFLTHYIRNNFEAVNEVVLYAVWAVGQRRICAAYPNAVMGCIDWRALQAQLHANTGMQPRREPTGTPAGEQRGLPGAMIEEIMLSRYLVTRTESALEQAFFQQTGKDIKDGTAEQICANIECIGDAAWERLFRIQALRRKTYNTPLNVDPEVLRKSEQSVPAPPREPSREPPQPEAKAKSKGRAKAKWQAKAKSEGAPAGTPVPTGGRPAESTSPVPTGGPGQAEQTTVATEPGPDHDLRQRSAAAEETGEIPARESHNIDSMDPTENLDQGWGVWGVPPQSEAPQVEEEVMDVDQPLEPKDLILTEKEAEEYRLGVDSFQHPQGADGGLGGRQHLLLTSASRAQLELFLWHSMRNIHEEAFWENNGQPPSMVRDSRFDKQGCLVHQYVIGYGFTFQDLEFTHEALREDRFELMTRLLPGGGRYASKPWGLSIEAREAMERARRTAESGDVPSPVPTGGSASSPENEQAPRTQAKISQGERITVDAYLSSRRPTLSDRRPNVTSDRLTFAAYNLGNLGRNAWDVAAWQKENPEGYQQYLDNLAKPDTTYIDKTQSMLLNLLLFTPAHIVTLCESASLQEHGFRSIFAAHGWTWVSSSDHNMTIMARSTQVRNEAPLTINILKDTSVRNMAPSVRIGGTIYKSDSPHCWDENQKPTLWYMIAEIDFGREVTLDEARAPATATAINNRQRPRVTRAGAHTVRVAVCHLHNTACTASPVSLRYHLSAFWLDVWRYRVDLVSGDGNAGSYRWHKNQKNYSFHAANWMGMGRVLQRSIETLRTRFLREVIESDQSKKKKSRGGAAPVPTGGEAPSPGEATRGSASGSQSGPALVPTSGEGSSAGAPEALPAATGRRAQMREDPRYACLETVFTQPHILWYNSSAVADLDRWQKLEEDNLRDPQTNQVMNADFEGFDCIMVGVISWPWECSESYLEPDLTQVARPAALLVPDELFRPVTEAECKKLAQRVGNLDLMDCPEDVQCNFDCKVSEYHKSMTAMLMWLKPKDGDSHTPCLVNIRLKTRVGAQRDQRSQEAVATRQIMRTWRLMRFVELGIIKDPTEGRNRIALSIGRDSRKAALAIQAADKSWVPTYSGWKLLGGSPEINLWRLRPVEREDLLRYKKKYMEEFNKKLEEDTAAEQQQQRRQQRQQQPPQPPSPPQQQQQPPQQQQQQQQWDSSWDDTVWWHGEPWCWDWDRRDWRRLQGDRRS